MIEVDIKKSLGDFNLNVCFKAHNTVMGLLGASGCGKSMTLKCIAGIETPDSGRIVLNDRVLFDSEKKINIPVQKRRVGYLFQNYALFSQMTVEKNLEMAVRKEDKKNCAEIINEVLENVKLKEYKKSRPTELSGGQRQRVALARILINKPEILMLDEPFSAIDEYLKWQLELELNKLFSEYKGEILLVSHNRDEIFRLCNEATIISRGESLETTKMDRLLENPATLASAILSGCKDYTFAEKKEKNIYKAINWGIDIKAESDIKDVKYLAIRRHYIKLLNNNDKNENVFKCRVLKVVDNMFSDIYLVTCKDAYEVTDKSVISVEVSKEESQKFIGKSELYIYIDPSAVIVLDR